MRQRERRVDLLKTQRHYRGHSEQDAYGFRSTAQTPQGAAPTVLALFKQQEPKAKKKKKKWNLPSSFFHFLVCLCFYPLSH